MEFKEECLQVVEKAREHNIDLTETPVLFKWKYDEEPKIEFQLLIRQEKEVEENTEDAEIIVETD